MNRISLLAAAVLCLAAWGLNGFGQTSPIDETPPVNFDALMQRKLASSQELIKGLALDDFELIEREAQTLQLLSLDAGWNTIQTDEYARISVEFREAAKRLARAAEDKNLDAAGLGYFKLTMTCIDCHRHVRNLEQE